jgi:uncharacterized protein
MRHRTNISMPLEQIADFCCRHHIRKLSLFGSVLRDDFGPNSDLDVLVEFEEGRAPGLIRLAGMELELSRILGGRRVDMNTPRCLSPYFREQVMRDAQVQYAQP